MLVIHLINKISINAYHYHETKSSALSSNTDLILTPLLSHCVNETAERQQPLQNKNRVQPLQVFLFKHSHYTSQNHLLQFFCLLGLCKKLLS